jgi:hypothetical protein
VRLLRACLKRGARRRPARDQSSKMFKMVNRLRAEIVRANTYIKFDPTSLFGDYEESGLPSRKCDLFELNVTRKSRATN